MELLSGKGQEWLFSQNVSERGMEKRTGQEKKGEGKRWPLASGCCEDPDHHPLTLLACHLKATPHTPNLKTHLQFQAKHPPWKAFTWGPLSRYWGKDDETLTSKNYNVLGSLQLPFSSFLSKYTRPLILKGNSEIHNLAAINKMSWKTELSTRVCCSG